MLMDNTIVDIWEDECKTLIESFPKNDRLITVQADDLLALIETWRDIKSENQLLENYSDGLS